MNYRSIVPQIGSPNPGEVWLSGNVTITGSGAISAQTGALKSGFTVAKNAADGRYDVTFDAPYLSCKAKFVSMDGPTSSAFPTTTGSDPQFRLSATPAKTATVQFVRTDTQADADAASGTVFNLIFCMQR